MIPGYPLAMLALLLSLALAADPAPCATDLDPLPVSFSVAWVTPVSERARSGTWLEVVRTEVLRAWLRDHPQADLARTLQVLALHRRDTPPRRTWRVTLFEVAPELVCRPVRDTELTELVGLTVCDGHTRRRSACGYTRDLADDGRGLDVLRVRWRDAAVRGFCTLPMDRFLAEGR